MKTRVIILLLSLVGLCIVCACCAGSLFWLVAGNSPAYCDGDKLLIDFPIDFCIN